jgi:UDP-glucose 4-epimerase
MRSSIKGKVVFVTGGGGFIGSHLIDRLLEEEVKQVITIENFFNGNKENLENAFEKGLILYTDDAEIDGTLEYIFNRHSIDVVFNCATKALNYSFKNPSNAYLTNVKILVNLLELQRKQRFKTLCHFSSSEAYGSSLFEPMEETHPLLPTTTYAAGKASADLLLQSYVKMFNIDAFIVRPFNNYGPRQNYSGDLAGVIPRTIQKILNGDAPEIHGLGDQKRDFIYVQDTVESVLKVYNKLTPGESVNICSENQVTIKELINKIASLLNFQGEVIYQPERIADVKSHLGSNEKLKSLVGNLKMTDFDQGLQETIKWYKGVIHHGKK